MAVEFDLLGDPIPRNHGERGRPERVATATDVSKVRTLLVAGLPKKRIAAELGLSVPTLNRIYFASGKISVRHAKDMALAEAVAKNLLQMQKAADEGNVSAMKAVRQVLEAASRSIADDDAAARAPARVPAAMAPGKKEAAHAAALDAEDELDDMFRSGPTH